MWRSKTIFTPRPPSDSDAASVVGSRQQHSLSRYKPDRDYQRRPRPQRSSSSDRLPPDASLDGGARRRWAIQERRRLSSAARSGISDGRYRTRFLQERSDIPEPISALLGRQLYAESCGTVGRGNRGRGSYLRLHAQAFYLVQSTEPAKALPPTARR